MLKPLSPKEIARRDKFKKLGQLISAMKPGDPNAPDYHTGRQSSFETKRYDALNRDSEDPLNRTKEDKPEVPLGPRFNTPQWERTVKK